MNAVNDVKILICEKTWKSKRWLRFIKKNKVPQLFLGGKISKSFIYPSRNNSEQKFQKNICFKIIGSHHTYDMINILLYKYIYFYANMCTNTV